MNEEILIATKEVLPADMLKLLIDNRKIDTIIETVHDGEKALDYIIGHRPRLIMLDLYLPILSALAVMEELSRVNLYPRVICFCEEITPVLCLKLFKAGISGIVDFRTPIEEAKKILHQVEIGKVIIPDLIEELIEKRDFEINQQKYTLLSMRQTEILHLAGNGYTNTEIAEILHISRKTVEKHKIKIRDKTGLSSSTKIAVYAITHGFIKVKEAECLLDAKNSTKTENRLADAG